MFSRRKFIFSMAAITGWLLRPRVVLSAQEASQFLKAPPLQNVKKAITKLSFKSIDDFLSENVRYDLAFLWFKKAAESKVSFSRDGKGYKAVLEAETKGVVGFFTSHRKHRYVSYLTYFPAENRVRTSVFERTVVIGKRKEETFTYLDYDKKMMEWKDYKKGRLVETKSEAIPDGIEYECILSAFYNFRLGFFGPIEKGRQFAVKTIPEKGRSTIDVDITSDKEALKKRRLFGKYFSKSFYNVNVKVPKDIFKSRSGEVSMLIDEEIVPVHGVVKDYIGFGDIKGRLVNI